MVAKRYKRTDMSNEPVILSHEQASLASKIHAAAEAFVRALLNPANNNAKSDNKQHAHHLSVLLAEIAAEKKMIPPDADEDLYTLLEHIIKLLMLLLEQQQNLQHNSGKSSVYADLLEQLHGLGPTLGTETAQEQSKSTSTPKSEKAEPKADNNGTKEQASNHQAPPRNDSKNHHSDNSHQSSHNSHQYAETPSPANEPQPNLYEVLGLDPTKASDYSANDIKKAYYKMARKCHPDKNPDDPNATENFQNVGKAYETLGDENRRTSYDCSQEASSSNQQSYNP